QSAMQLPTNLTTDPELVWALKHRRNVLLDIIADRCTSNLILRSIAVSPALQGTGFALKLMTELGFVA
ncbi:hypothetical protein B4926_19395, partial [Vibrio cholerae]|nr:hypothetical protein [Vibrio cholerae]